MERVMLELADTKNSQNLIRQTLQNYVSYTSPTMCSMENFLYNFLMLSSALTIQIFSHILSQVRTAVVFQMQVLVGVKFHNSQTQCRYHHLIPCHLAIEHFS